MEMRGFLTCRPVLLMIIVLGLLLDSGCQRQRRAATDREAVIPGIHKVVVVGFRASMSEGESADKVRDPDSGTIIIREPVSPAVVDRMTGILFDQLVAQKKYEFVSPGQAKGVYSDIVRSDKTVGVDYIRVLQEVGKAFKADAALGGHLYRWHEREGSAAGVSRPASVAFDLQFVRPSDGAVLWRGKFDKTQRSLSENLFDAKTFFQGKGRWMTAEELAGLGLRRLLMEMPGDKAKGKE
jgi:hypothetical protein